MAKQPLLKFAARVDTSSRVDAAAGVVFGVSVITEGPALGHSAWSEDRMQSVPLYADSTTLSQVLAAARTYAGGLKVKMNHDGGAGDIVGSLKEFRIEGNQLRADLHLLKSAESREYVLELAATMPESFGLSIAFSGSPQFSADRANARCIEIYSCDIVDAPAANPDGLFDVKRNDEALRLNTFPMDDATKQEFSALIAEATKPLADKLAALEGRIPTAEATASAFSEKVDSAITAKLAAQSKTDETLLRSVLKEVGFGVAPGAAAAPSGEGAAPSEKFEDLVNKHVSLGKKQFEAISLSMVENPKLYDAYTKRVQAGEKIVFKSL